MTSKLLIDHAYLEAEKKGLNQSKWSEKAGFAVNGQTISRIRKSGDCRLSTFIELLDAIGYELVMIEKI